MRSILIVMVLGFFLGSCKKETTAHVSKEVLVSYPGISLNGDELVILPVGGTYTELGAKLTDDISGEVSDLEPSSSNVNTQEPGLYIVTYSAMNANGFETSVARKVAVTDVTGTVDYSGEYLRPATGIAMTIERPAEGVYKITNPGGASIGGNTIVYVVETSPGEYVAPDQPTDAGTMSLEDIAFTEDGVATWVVLNINYGDAPRVFVKQ